MTEDKRTQLERGSIKQTVKGAALTFELIKDFEKFSSGSIVMTATHATFTHPETKEAGSVGVDLGGTQIEVTLGGRAWVIPMQEIVALAMDADTAYRKGIWDGHESQS